MECNKEEAMRAKEIAERRMLNKDFVGARKIALKAQQLCPDLESISHMILVCDVHCSSTNKVCGDEKDWYSILNIDPSADESSIKKQYRKYALSLHPDKNSFAGSTDAFKLIGEAQMVLLDRNKRLIYDSKYKASSQRGNLNVPQQTGVNNHSANKGFDTKKQQSRASNDKSTFWTLCPSCCIKYRFSADLVNTSLWCKTCKLYFTGQEIRVEVTPTQKERKPKKWFPKKNSQRDRENSTSKGIFQENISHGKRTRESVQTRGSPEMNKKSKLYENCANVGVKSDKFDVGYRPQRCTQSKIHSYYSKHSFEDQFSEQKTPEAKTAYYQNGDECNDNEKGLIKSTNYGHQSSSEVYLVSDPDFSNFDKYRREECFEIGQIWAVYDTIDAMPRFYALIKEVFLPDFKLLITWLEPDPDDKEECNWVCEGLPVSCGKFKLGNSEFIEDRLMLSHLVNYERESGSDTYRIYPKKGEAWALFKNWDDWQSDEDIKKKIEFEYVEILSDYANDTGVSISYLKKAKGFSCLFCQSVKGLDSFQILPNQLFRFSHRVPSFQMSGDEREDVPIGSFELDPCSLLPNLEEFEISKFPNTCLDSNFNDFNMNKREECFSVGQIWALYDSLDAMPRFYALLEEVSFSPVFEVQLTWVEPDPRENEEIKWVYEGLPVSCGKFKLGNSETIQDHLMFSHLVLEEKASGSETYQIYPKEGETWALFKDWNIKWNSNKEGKIDYEFEFVEILTDYDAGLGVSIAYLRKVNGFSCLFCRKEYKTKSFHIRPNDIFRFSHKVPSFRMNSKEQKDVPKGSFELDPGSLPSPLK